eukprot:g5062.t1
MARMSEAERMPDAVANLIEVRRRYRTEESTIRGMNFKPGPNDVIISTAPKTGITVVQQICHGLRSGGDMNFDEIILVSPCLEMAYDYGYKDLYALQPFQPQTYKTHFSYDDTPKGAGKYITVVRKPADTAVSLFHFFEDWFFKKGEVSIEDFMKWIWLKRSAPKTSNDPCAVFHHIMSWYPHRLDKNVLWLHFEDIKQNRCECVRLIAEFLNIGVNNEELQELITNQSSFEFMKKHSKKFDGHPLKYARNEAAGLPRTAGLTGNAGKVRSGLSNSAKDIFSKWILTEIDAQWNEYVTSVTGYKNYEEFRYGINKELNRTLF